MLERHEFCDHCPGCRPALLNAETGQPLPADDPLMVKVAKIWATETTYAERKAFIDVTVHNSRAPADLRRCQSVVEKFQR